MNCLSILIGRIYKHWDSLLTLNVEQIYEDIIRGTTSVESKTCQNARIQNVFGGILPAEFVANNDMKYRCSGPSTYSIDDLRREILSKVAASVLEVPIIKTTHDLN